MAPNRTALLDLPPLGCDPVRLHDDDTDPVRHRDLALARGAVAVGIDHASVLAELLERLAEPPTRDACG